MENRLGALFPGGTDYTGVGIDVILAHLTGTAVVS
jgi:hypothetical protein